MLMEKDLMLSLTIHGVRGSMPATGKNFQSMEEIQRALRLRHRKVKYS